MLKSNINNIDGDIFGYVPWAYVSSLMDYASERNLELSKVFGNDFFIQSSEGSLFPVWRWKTALEKVSLLLDDPYLGLHLGQTIKPRHFGILGLLFVSTNSVADTLLRLEKYQRLYYDVNPLVCKIEGGSMIMEWGTAAGRPGPLVDETAITSLVQLAREYTGLYYSPEHIYFVNKKPNSIQPYIDYFGCDVDFDAKFTAVKIPLSYLQIPLISSNPKLAKELDDKISTLFMGLSNRDNLELSVRRSIIMLIRDGSLSLDKVAQLLSISKRSLQRGLSQRNLKFRYLIDDTKRLIAEEMIRDSNLKLVEVAQLLGYSEQSAFSRSLRRWREDCFINIKEGESAS